MAVESKARFKIWKATTDSAAGFMITPDTAVMAGSPKNFIAVNESSTYISGPISLVTSGEQIRQGGLFIHMNDFVRMIPSTIVTPIPPQIPFPPVQLFASIAKQMPFVLAMAAV